MEQFSAFTGEPAETKPIPNQPLMISPEGKLYLMTAAKWSFFLAIAGFILIAFMILVSLSLIFLSTIMSEYRDFQSVQYMPIPMLSMGIIYLIGSILYFFPYYYLYIFSEKIKSGLQTENQENLDEGLKNLKKMFKFVGILTIIALALILLMIPIMIFSLGMMSAIFG